MARQRRGGFRPELRGTLGTLLRTTLEQAGAVLERGARTGRSRLDEALSGRRRKDALADLGELVLDLIRRGEIDLAELPEARELVQHLDELDADGGGGGGGGAGAADSRDDVDERIATPPSRGRFDARGRTPAADPSSGSSSSSSSSSSAARDGTTSSRSWSPPKPSAPQRVWRPTLDDGPAPDAHPAPLAPEARPARAAVPPRRGGIQFDDGDEDLADYMHPDDVPPKPPGSDDR